MYENNADGVDIHWTHGYTTTAQQQSLDAFITVVIFENSFNCILLKSQFSLGTP
jgi:hypothetical protein